MTDSTVAVWEAMALPESADEYDEWRGEALRLIGLMAQTAQAIRDAAGRVLYLELRYRGEAAYAALRDELADRLDVSDRTLRRWRLLVEQGDRLPAASPKAEGVQRAARANRERAGSAHVAIVATTPLPAITPDAVIPPRARTARPSSVVAKSETPVPVSKPAIIIPDSDRPVQMAFEWPPRLVAVLDQVPRDRLDALAEAIEKWLAKDQAPKPASRGDVTPNFRGSSKK